MAAVPQLAEGTSSSSTPASGSLPRVQPEPNSNSRDAPTASRSASSHREPGSSNAGVQTCLPLTYHIPPRGGGALRPRQHAPSEGTHHTRSDSWDYSDAHPPNHDHGGASNAGKTKRKLVL